MMEKQANIPIGGFQKQSLIDYYGHISAVIFTCNCNFRCLYCHNAQLVYPNLVNLIPKTGESEILAWLGDNKKFLDAVVISGGEPTMHATLPLFIKQIKKLNLKVKLDTNGTNPDMLELLIKKRLVDYIAMDIKAPLTLAKYKIIVGDSFNQSLLNSVLRSVVLLNEKKVDSEFRTTMDEHLSMEDFFAIAERISKRYYIQEQHKNGNTATVQSVKTIAQKQVRDFLVDGFKTLEVFLR